jgi:hypothetical protein
MLTPFLAIWNILQTFGIFYEHLVHFPLIWYIFSSFGIMSHEISGNPAADTAEPLKRVKNSRREKRGIDSESCANANFPSRVARFVLPQHTKTGKYTTK